MSGQKRKRERGQTIAIVAISLVALLAMAALAIDVVTLYVARSEAQRAADAVALAGAKAFVDSGVTTAPGDATLQTLATTIANAEVSVVAQQNKISGTPAQVVGSPVFNYSLPGNPQITITVQKTDLPIFFARIWGRRVASVSATATAEAYNPSYSQSSANTGGVTIPVAPLCVKPWLVPNIDPDPSRPPGTPLITLGSGAVFTPGAYPGGVVGEPITLKTSCTDLMQCLEPAHNPGQPTPGVLQFVPALVTPSTSSVCPASCVGASNYEQSVSCCDGIPYACGGAVTNAMADINNTDPWNVETSNGVQCLIHAVGLGMGQGQDSLDLTGFPTGPMLIRAGLSDPLIGAGSPVTSGSAITTSNSVATFPVFDSTNPIPSSGQVTVIGFVQVFITDMELNVVNPAPNHYQIDGIILNVSGCGNNLGASPSPIKGGGISPVPIRLVHS